MSNTEQSEWFHELFKKMEQQVDVQKILSNHSRLFENHVFNAFKIPPTPRYYFKEIDMAKENGDMTSHITIGRYVKTYYVIDEFSTYPPNIDYENINRELLDYVYRIFNPWKFLYLKRL